MDRIAKNWVLTVNNFTEADIVSLENVDLTFVSYLVCGREVAPTTGTSHLQIYFELFGRSRLGIVVRRLNLSSGHFEPRRGTQAQAVAYCKKEGNFFERGTLFVSAARGPAAGKNKLLPLIPELKKGLSSFSEHSDVSFSMLKHGKEFLAINESPRDRDVDLSVVWLWGTTGVGKSRMVYDYCTSIGESLYSKPVNNKWFDGYDGERYVLFDDFRDSQYEFSYLLRLLDRYPLRVEIKGGYRQFKASVIFITCPYPPTEAYKGVKADSGSYDKHAQLIRRITHVIEVNCYNSSFETLIPLLRGQGVFTPPRSLYPVVPPIVTPDLHTPTNQIRNRLNSPLPRSLARRFVSPTQAWQLVSSDSE